MIKQVEDKLYLKTEATLEKARSKEKIATEVIKFYTLYISLSITNNSS